ncbi:hypothetical protein EVU91_11640 [Macrococcoides bohemicum]|uniref:DUF7448 domain-containing protein n=1 Tax=Macrococcoides bohemicum TaxID=1903056 RepID=UPI00105A6226|nr:hypothetical protein [Macrococcus bohemicus]TDL35696.1 hypothetical protein EVU91_11640 [Macrococcus bohemicus]
MIDKQDFEKVKELLLFKKVVEWTDDYIILEDGTKVEVYCSEQDCCAYAGGTFKNVELDAVITDVDYKVEKDSEWDEYGDTRESEAVLTLFHNQNVIAQNMVEANGGNGGYYYSVASLKIGEFELPILDA